MSFVGRSEAERRAMLERIGAASIEELWSAIPAEFRVPGPLALPAPLAEYEVARRFEADAARNADAGRYACFLGAGIYDHFVPSAVRALTSRSEYATAYTPYQPEVAQGTLQVIFEYQSMIRELTGMEVANASVYDAGTAAAEAAHLAAGAKGRRRVVVSAGLHPHHRQVLATYASAGNFEIVETPLAGGRTDPAAAKAALGSGDAAAFLWAQPNFEGIVEDGVALTEAAHAVGAYSAAIADPIALSLLTPPGAQGADIVVGEGQPLGVSMSYGGPLVGFFAIRKSDVRRLPGRLSGVTVDLDGRRGFVLTLQTREQHIRRERATSNICTNQGLMALANTIHLALLGAEGMRDVATQCLERAHYLADQAARVPGVTLAHGAPFFREFVLRLPGPATSFVSHALGSNLLAGVPLSRFDRGRPNDLLVAVTEKRSREEMDRYVASLTSWAASRTAAPVEEAACPR